MRGFTSARVVPLPASITSSRIETPTCGAARPIPTSSCMVSTMSATRARISGVTSPTGFAFWRSTGSP
jgi:hypothetical protein